MASKKRSDEPLLMVPTELSSRPERSVVEGPAVSPRFSRSLFSPQIGKIYFPHLSIVYNSDVVLAGGRKLCNIWS
jgi:hypothetical protein